MKAVKANKEYSIDEGSKSFYKNQGFDIYGDDGSLIEYGVGKTVSYAEHQRVLDELESLKAEHKKDSAKAKA